MPASPSNTSSNTTIGVHQASVPFRRRPSFIQSHYHTWMVKHQKQSIPCNRLHQHLLTALIYGHLKACAYFDTGQPWSTIFAAATWRQKVFIKVIITQGWSSIENSLSHVTDINIIIKSQPLYQIGHLKACAYRRLSIQPWSALWQSRLKSQPVMTALGGLKIPAVINHFGAPGLGSRLKGQPVMTAGHCASSKVFKVYIFIL